MNWCQGFESIEYCLHTLKPPSNNVCIAHVCISPMLLSRDSAAFGHMNENNNRHSSWTRKGYHFASRPTYTLLHPWTQLQYLLPGGGEGTCPVERKYNVMRMPSTVYIPLPSIQMYIEDPRTKHEGISAFAPWTFTHLAICSKSPCSVAISSWPYLQDAISSSPSLQLSRKVVIQSQN
jgi:hypothetical protein